MNPAEQTAISSDPPRLTASLIERREKIGLAETTDGGSRSIVLGATWRSDGPTAVLGPLPPTIGRYQVLRSLGAGGMGEVVLARDPELDRRVAIKLLKAGRDHGEAQVRLLREAQAMARLSHPNVVQIHDVGVFGDRVFLAMELIEGATLAQWLAAQRRDWRAVVRMFIEAGRGLAAAHAAGLVHRDFKPDNVLIASDGRVCVADFGLARGAREASEQAENPGERPLLVHTLTAAGAVMGTPLYMSPEQHLGVAAGPASDVFSFSVALFEALYGVRPFAGETMAELAANVIAGKVVAVPPRSGVPKWLDALVRRGLAADPAQRFPGFAPLLTALARDPARTRRRWGLGLGLGLAAGLAGATLQASRGPEVCGGGTAAIAAVWDDARRAAIVARVGETEPRVVAGLQTYADAWSAMHREACEQHQRGEASTGLLDLRMRCLEQRRQGFAGAVEVLAAADAAGVREAPVVVARLTPLTGCADVDALLREVPAPEDEATAAAVTELRGRLARVKPTADAGRPAEAQRAAAAIRGEAEALGYRPLIAAAWLAEGRAAFDATAWEPAREAFARAFVAATAAGDDAVAAEARARQLFADGVLGGAATAALAAGPHAEALVIRLGDRGDLDGLLANNLGVLHLIGGDEAAARDRFARAIARTDGDGRTDPIDRAGYLTNAARVAEDMSVRTGLYDQAAALLAAALGPAHPMTMKLEVDRAIHAAGPTAAAAILADDVERLLAARAERHEECAEGLLALAQAYDELGRTGDAAATLAAAARCLDVAVSTDEAAPAEALRRLVRGARGMLDGDEAGLAELEAARAAFTPHVALVGVVEKVWWIRLALARVHLRAGRDAAAHELLAALIAEMEAAPAGIQWSRRYTLARARVALAGLLRRDPAGDRARIAGLLDAAEAVYRAGAGEPANLAAVAALR